MLLKRKLQAREYLGGSVVFQLFSVLFHFHQILFVVLMKYSSSKNSNIKVPSSWRNTHACSYIIPKPKFVHFFKSPNFSANPGYLSPMLLKRKLHLLLAILISSSQVLLPPSI